jgi:hypothetical protein
MTRPAIPFGETGRLPSAPVRFGAEEWAPIVQLAPLGPMINSPEEVQKNCTRDSLQFNPRFGQDALDALTRAVDRIDSSFRII